MKRLFKFTLAIALLVGMVLPVTSTADEPKRGGTLTMSTRKDLTTMNPLVTTRSTDRSIRDLMFEPLLGIDLKGKFNPIWQNPGTSPRMVGVSLFTCARGLSSTMAGR